MSESSDMAALVAALQAQTEAINRLAESNQQVVDYLLSQDVDVTDDGAGGPQFLEPDEID
ncbi:hypothetical protein [Vreelandella olivaria]|uniref:hypothetical protein n=1 Tax=Vreelandella olivaria TaxID=390919 RepID=UPI00201ECC68|nr:hypothetical protein [Halomonas olivaria]